jgi:hypothetical protein
VGLADKAEITLSLVRPRAVLERMSAVDPGGAEGGTLSVLLRKSPRVPAIFMAL